MASIDHVYDADQVIERMGEVNSGLCREIEELKGGPGSATVVIAEQHSQSRWPRPSDRRPSWLNPSVN